MKQVLLKTLEILRAILAAALELARRVFALLGSVKIDQPRGVLLCVVFQVVLLGACLRAFHRPDAAVERPAVAPALTEPPIVTESPNDGATSPPSETPPTP